MDKHLSYIEDLCRMESDPMINVYNEELSYLKGERKYDQAPDRHIVSTIGTKLISQELLTDLLGGLVGRFNVPSDLVEFENNYIEFKSPLLVAWVDLHLRTNPKERGK
jgi:hypothetical protein